MESSLVLIPLMALFLIASQITIAMQSRNWEKITAQDSASQEAISGEFDDSNTYVHIYSLDRNQNLDLVVSHKSKSLPELIPGLSTLVGSKSKVKVSGLAIIENQR